MIWVMLPTRLLVAVGCEIGHKQSTQFPDIPQNGSWSGGCRREYLYEDGDDDGMAV